jgi:hypothetical protein
MAKGIDYGMGLANIDNATGIRYGVIHAHSVNPDALDDIYTRGENLSYKAAKDEAQATLRQDMESTLDDLGVLPYSDRQRYVARVSESVWDDIEQEWNDHYEEDNDTYRYGSDGYVIETSWLGLYVIKSPFYTLAAYCSPCCPGAGDLDTPDPEGVKTYCLGPDWFEDNTAPYPVFNVETEATNAD